MSWPTFPVPKVSLVADVIQSPSGAKPITEDAILKKTIENHPLNQFLQLVVPIKVSTSKVPTPQTSQVPTSKVPTSKVPTPRVRIRNAIEEVKMNLSLRLPLTWMMLNGSLPPNECLSFFKVKNVPLQLLFHQVFIESFIKSGTVVCVSINADIVTDDCLAIFPTRLILSLTKKSYQKLGLEGKTSILTKKNVIEKKIVEIDFQSHLSSRFDSKYYKRTFSCMKSSGLKFDILIRWKPDNVQNSNVASESIGKFFEFMKMNPERKNSTVFGGSLTEKEASKMVIFSCLPTIRSFSTSRQLIPSTVIDFTRKEFDTVSKPKEFDTVSKPKEFDTVSKPKESNTVSKPGEFDTVSKPKESNTVSKPKEFDTVSKPGEFDTVSKPQCPEDGDKSVESINEGKEDLDLLLEDILDFAGSCLCSISSRLDEGKVDINCFGFRSRCNDFEANQILSSETCGFIPVEFIQELLEEIQQNGLLEEIPFILIIINGFDDSVVSHTGKRNEKGKDLSGENMYGILITSTESSEDENIRNENIRNKNVGSESSEDGNIGTKTEEEVDGEPEEKRARREEEEKEERREEKERREEEKRREERKPNKCLLWRLSDAFDYSIEKL